VKWAEPKGLNDVRDDIKIDLRICTIILSKSEQSLLPSTKLKNEKNNKISFQTGTEHNMGLDY
jgi:hypothetical protein